jgi:hydroxymethylpyrimidine/phosphomethylpyrimidine kinase
MLVFRKGTWYTVDVHLSDPLLTEGHKRTAASIIASRLEKGSSMIAATAAAEKTLYLQIYSGLLSREEHGPPKN